MPARILIVEDERVTAEDLGDILTDLGYIVTALVASGAEAIQEAEKNPPDLALMDLHIQGDMDGADTARILREQFKIPAIYLTAHADGETLTRAKDAEPLGYVMKPFQEAGLHASIEMALYKHGQEIKARENEELLASTLRALSEGVISLNSEGRITLFNPAAEVWTGQPRSEAIGKPVEDVFRVLAGERAETIAKPWRQTLATGSIGELPADAVLLSATGDKRRVSGSTAAIHDHTGAIAGAVLVFGKTQEDGAVRSPAPSAQGDGNGRADANGVADGNGMDLGSFRVIAASPAMKQLLAFARRVAQSEVSTILVEGESGTGKDVLAQFLHYHGRRREGPFIALNCAAIPESLLESELFGYEKGAFTDARTAKAGILEVASGGSIFLDEIGEMPLTVQAKLLRVLEEQSFRRLGGVRDMKVDVRVVAATNRKLTDAIDEGKFRLDLYYRINVIQISMPALRDRTDDILPLAEHFVQLYNARFKRNVLGVSPLAAADLVAYRWPGNVRELRNVMERAMVLEDSDYIQRSSLNFTSNGGASPPSGAAPEEIEAPFQASLAENEKNLVMRALQKTGGNQTRAAVLLGISRDTLRYKMKKFNLR